ncbi:hypothetical protein ACRE_026030 [Hapsidospora chrysogenum ATCC 11550]|uniref:Uncharacterized protein n=1 Tax=Hapsidospora chrysogenum (strain ATCC 11550 / CBS 779.69 / DSM 880 / IAM 14645 / JCM 23072 / IMI 49137) TaxID=857340 RepID=A0A086TB01_HAPC1|nr:hypothetical protein ACRE_026030 [Hapsidospora chrysogenum ATCC 11550]
MTSPCRSLARATRQRLTSPTILTAFRSFRSAPHPYISDPQLYLAYAYHRQIVELRQRLEDLERKMEEAFTLARRRKAEVDGRYSDDEGLKACTWHCDANAVGQ